MLDELFRENLTTVAKHHEEDGSGGFRGGSLEPPSANPPLQPNYFSFVGKFEQLLVKV